MRIERFPILGVVLVEPPRFGDARGWFSEVFQARRFAEAGIAGPFTQENQSFSARQGTIRGLHCQIPPAAQGKLVRVVRGAVLDLAIDIRQGSPTYGQHVAVQLSAENGAQLWIPEGFLHGFETLTPDVEVIYKVTHDYDRSAERGVLWNDPDLRLPWRVNAQEAVLSEKDSALPRLAACEPWFRL